jgi:hypothetical protein
MTKKQMVLEFMKAGNAITSLVAIQKFGATRLSAIIYDLKADGYDFITTNVTVKDRFSNDCNVAEYKLVMRKPPGQAVLFETAKKNYGI